MNDSILLVSNGILHPPLLGRYWLWRDLKAQPDLNLQRVSSLEALPNLPLERLQGMVLYLHDKTISPSALAALDRFVGQGGGLLALHSTTASFKQESAYFDILGGQFTTHGPVETFQVEPAQAQDPVFANIGAFNIRDELYLHDYDGANQVHFHANLANEWQPIVWTRLYNQGRVSYCSLGHCIATMRHPAVQTVIQRGLLSACRMES